MSTALVVTQEEVAPAAAVVTFAKGDRVLYPEDGATLAGTVVAVISGPKGIVYRIRDAAFTGVFPMEAGLLQKA